MNVFEFTEFLSYLVTVVGFPFAIIVFWLDQRKGRANERDELNHSLSDEYTDFLKLVLENADLRLLSSQGGLEALTAEQRERKFVIFGILIALFERAYITLYEPKMDSHTRRVWSSWEDYMREWCLRPDFNSVLPQLLDGEDPEFGEHIMMIAQSNLVRSSSVTSTL